MTKLKTGLFLLLLKLFSPLQAQEVQAQNRLIIGWYFPSINATVSRTDFQVALDFWVHEFSQSLSFDYTEVKLYDHIKELQTDFNEGELSFIVAPPLMIVQNFDLNMLADGFVGISTTGNPYAMAILARKDKQVRTLKDVQQKRLLLPENDVLADTFLNSLLIPEFAQLNPQVFRSVRYKKKHNAIILGLFFDQADVGVAYLETFDLMAELNPQIKKSIAVLAQFPIDSPNYSFFHYQFPEELRLKIIDAALKLNTSVKAQQTLNNFRMASLIPCPVSSLQPFIALDQRYKALLKSLKQ